MIYVNLPNNTRGRNELRAQLNRSIAMMKDTLDELKADEIAAKYSITRSGFANNLRTTSLNICKEFKESTKFAGRIGWPLLRADIIAEKEMFTELLLRYEEAALAELNTKFRVPSK